MRTTGLCPDIILEIIEYLTLNDIVNSFAFDILPFLWTYKGKLHVTQPSEVFMNGIIQRIDHEKIVSLRLNAKDLRLRMKLDSSVIFKHIKSLTLTDSATVNSLINFQEYFPNLQRLCLHYINEINFRKLCRIFNQIQIPIKQFEIHGDFIQCSHHRTYPIYAKLSKFNYTVQSFLLHVKNLVDMCEQDDDTCFVRTTIDFIETMRSVQDVRFVIDEGNVASLLDVNRWKNLITTYPQLNKVILEVIKNTSQDTELKQKILDSEKELNNIRENFKFCVGVK